MANIHAKSNSRFLSVCVKYTTVLLQHVNSEMLMADVEPFVFCEVLATDCLGHILVY